MWWQKASATTVTSTRPSRAHRLQPQQGAHRGRPLAGSAVRGEVVLAEQPGGRVAHQRRARPAAATPAPAPRRSGSRQSRLVADPVDVAPPDRREPGVEPGRRDRDVPHGDVVGQRTVEPPGAAPSSTASGLSGTSTCTTCPRACTPASVRPAQVTATDVECAAPGQRRLQLALRPCAGRAGGPSRRTRRRRRPGRVAAAPLTRQALGSSAASPASVSSTSSSTSSSTASSVSAASSLSPPRPASSASAARDLLARARPPRPGSTRSSPRRTATRPPRPVPARATARRLARPRQPAWRARRRRSRTPWPRPARSRPSARCRPCAGRSW